MDPTAILAAAQAVMGGVQAIAGHEKSKRLLGQLQPYKTPSQYYDIANATKSMAQQGYDAFTLNYLTTQTNQAFASTATDATRLGANPNDLAALFNQKVNSIMKVGADNHMLNMKNLQSYFDALNVLGENNAAEQKSKQDLIKDQLQAASAQQQAGGQNLFGAANTATDIYANSKIKNLYTDPTMTVPNITSSGRFASQSAGIPGVTAGGIGSIGGAFGSLPDLSGGSIDLDSLSQFIKI